MAILRLRIGGLGCAACATLLEEALRRLPGLTGARVDAVSAEARVSFTDATLADDVLRTIRRLGYTVTPAGSEAAARERQAEERASLKRLAVAGFGMMQVMMFALALYAGDDYRMDPAIVTLLRWWSLVVTVPVATYAGAPVLLAAVRQLRAGQAAMDVPVALGLGVALLASVWNTVTDRGHVYFDAVTMFLFLLALSRHLELRSRHEVGNVTEALAWLLPATALRARTGRTEAVPIGELVPGDLIRVNRGDAVAADGVIESGSSLFDESCLTGESRPVARTAGDRVKSGSICVGNGIDLRVTATGAGTELASVLALLDRSLGARRGIPLLASTAARWFSVVVVAIAALVGVGWLQVDPARAVASTIAVLVVACPCALSLSAPVVQASAQAALARLGLLTVSATGLERLAGIRHVVFDKTGTLTAGRPAVEVDAPEQLRWLPVAAALERGSSHPLAAAFRPHEDPSVVAEQIDEQPGVGVTGLVSGVRYQLAAAPGDGSMAATLLSLTDAAGERCRFRVIDSPRPGAADAIRTLARRGIGVEIASGDAVAPVRQLARQLGIAVWGARMTFADKVARVQALQAAGTPVLMVGDGVNDAPVLATADCSIAMRSGSALAQAGGDFLLLDSAWTHLPRAFAVARRARAILRQNLAWAAVYNLAAIPLAAGGALPPWLAALGMSLSSALVVLNAARLR
jgi:Cu2+-exporting ATPase